MATNVTEKDKTLNEIIDWVKSRCHEAGLSRFDVRRKSDRDFYDGQVNAFHEMLELCRSMLGYSGSMPSEVPNQKRGMMSKDSEALYEFAHWLSEKGREAREELVYKRYTPWIDDVALGRLEAYDEAYKHCREMLGNADSIFSPKFDKETKQSEDAEE